MCAPNKLFATNKESLLSQTYLLLSVLGRFFFVRFFQPLFPLKELSQLAKNLEEKCVAVKVYKVEFLATRDLTTLE